MNGACGTPGRGEGYLPLSLDGKKTNVEGFLACFLAYNLSSYALLHSHTETLLFNCITSRHNEKPGYTRERTRLRVSCGGRGIYQLPAIRYRTWGIICTRVGDSKKINHKPPRCSLVVFFLRSREPKTPLYF
jgi:hypothetical protein